MSSFTILPAIGLAILTSGLISGLLSGPTLAQNLFSPVARVNEAVITEFEVQQRARFLSILNSPGSTRQASLDALIEDRLRMQAAQSVGLELTDEGLQTGLEDFASRANLTVEEFVQGLEQAGVSQETFRDFVAIQLVWRDLIRARFGNRVQISEDDVDRAIAAAGQTSGIRVLLSEIIIPAPPNRAAAVQAQAEVISQVTTQAEFSSFARRLSATASARSGGRLDWSPLNNLPPVLRSLVLSLGLNEVTEPIPIPNAVALFQLRGIEETGAPEQDFAAIEYAAYYIDGGRSPAALATAENIREAVDICDDLYGIAQGQPEEVLERGSLAPDELPADIALELAKLDPGEVSTNLTRADGRTLVFLMLCGRTPEVGEEVDRDAVRNGLRQQRFQGFANALLDELRAAADIEVFVN